MTKFRLETYLLIYIYINGYNFVIYFKKKLLPFNKLFIVILYSYTTGNALISVHNLLFRYLYYIYYNHDVGTYIVIITNISCIILS